MSEKKRRQDPGPWGDCIFCGRKAYDKICGHCWTALEKLEIGGKRGMVLIHKERAEFLEKFHQEHEGERPELWQKGYDHAVREMKGGLHDISPFREEGWIGTCGHHWNKSESEECPVCRMKELEALAAPAR